MLALGVLDSNYLRRATRCLCGDRLYVPPSIFALRAFAPFANQTSPNKLGFVILLCFDVMSSVL